MKKLLTLSLLLTAYALNIFAQAGIGAISGTVRDASGAVVPGAKVTVANESKGIRREMETNDAGLFSAPALVPSAGYSINVSKPGFTGYSSKDINLNVGQIIDVAVTLSLATAATTVEVTAAPTLIESDKSGVTDVVDQERIDDLPINGRRADTFALLTPGVVRDGTFGLVTFHGISSGNSFLTDGISTTNSFYDENAGRTRISASISEDAVQEFEVISDGYSAEYGRAMGGIINTVTRSGTNEYHGTAYEFFRNRTLEAADRYSHDFAPPEWRHQGGATLGGPVTKDKVFFFSNFEFVKRNFPGLNEITSTQISDATGLHVNPANCVAPATPAQCAAAIAFIQAQIGILVPRSISSVMGFLKLDYHINAANTLTLSFNIMHWRSPNGIQNGLVVAPSGALLGNNGNSTVETRFGNANLVSILNANTVNNLRAGWFKDRLSDPAISTVPSTGLAYITVAGATVGAAEAYPRTFPSETRWEADDSLSLVRGSHAFKVGADVSTTEDWINQLFNGNGAYSYSNLTNFALDLTGNTTGAKHYSSFSQEFGNPIQDLHTKAFDLFALDTWKATRKLTINYGIRYEKTILPQPTLVDPNYAQTGHIPGTNKDFGPRIGIAYALDEKTVIRTGYGLFYAPYITDGIDSLFLGNSRYQTSISVLLTQAGAPVFPFPLGSSNGFPAGTVSLTFAAPNFRNPYSEQGTASVQRQLGRAMDVTASYIYTRGLELITSPDVNLSYPSTTATYTIDDASGNPVGTYTTPVWTAANKIDTRYSHIYEVANGGNSWYNGLALQFRKRFAKGLTAMASYTWSHAIDDAQQAGASTTVAYTQSSTYNGNNILDKGSSGTDQRHRAVINWLWSPKFTSGNSAFARYFVNGWELSTITTLASGEPLSGTVSVSGTQFPATPLLYTSSINGSGGWSRVPFWPVDSLYLARQYTVDGRLTRNIPINDRVKLALKFEGFNIFNTQYNTGAATTAFTASGGIIKPQTGYGVGNSSAAFPDGTNARKAQVAIRLTF
jgi:hypothetical protein